MRAHPVRVRTRAHHARADETAYDCNVEIGPEPHADDVARAAATCEAELARWMAVHPDQPWIRRRGPFIRIAGYGKQMFITIEFSITSARRAGERK